MGFYARKSFKVMPGVRMTVSPRGVSTSVGGKGFRVTCGASGRVTRTVGIPGSGVRHTKTISPAKRSPARRPAQAAPRAPRATTTTPPAPAPPQPGLFAPRWEKQLFGAVVEQRWDWLPQIAAEYPEAAPVAATLDGLQCVNGPDPRRSAEVLRWAGANAGEIEDHPFVREYLGDVTAAVTVADGVQAQLPVSRDAIGLALVEAEQR